VSRRQTRESLPTTCKSLKDSTLRSHTQNYHRRPISLSSQRLSLDRTESGPLSQRSSHRTKQTSDSESRTNPKPHALCLSARTPLKPSRKRSSRNASRTAGEAYANAQLDGYAADPNATPRPGRVLRKPAPASAPRPPAPDLHKTAVPEWDPAPGASDSDYTDRGELNRPMSSVTESTDSRTRSRSPTKRMIGLRVAEKTVSSKTVRSLADVPEDVRKLYKEIQSLARVPLGVVPQGIEVRVLILLNSSSLIFPPGSAPSRCW
jgi:hypothetical protein